jgi:hypothetical protein
MMADRYEFAVWAEGYATDADGNMLDADGNLIEPPETEDQQEES